MPSRLSLPRSVGSDAEAAGLTGDEWLVSFHRGDRSTLAACYRDHFATVDRAIGSLLTGADRETMIHEVFSRLIDGAAVRRSFSGGSFGAWLTTIARNQAIDYCRRLGREVSLAEVADRREAAGGWQDSADARLLVEQFRQQHLPAAWAGVFDLRFLQQLPQREAALRLCMRRTTLAYQEMRIRQMLKHFLLGRGDP